MTGEALMAVVSSAPAPVLSLLEDAHGRCDSGCARSPQHSEPRTAPQRGRLRHLGQRSGSCQAACKRRRLGSIGGGGVRRKVWSPQSTDVAQLRIFSQLLPVTVAGRGGVYILRASVNTRAERCGLLDFEIFWFCVCSGV